MYRQRGMLVCKREKKNDLVIFLFGVQYFLTNCQQTQLQQRYFFFSRNIVCAGYHRKTWIQAVCALCTHPSFSQSVSHNSNASRSNFAFKSCGLTQRGSFLPHTSSEKRKNQKDTKSRLAIQWGENSFCHSYHSVRDYSGDPRPMLPLHPSCIPSFVRLHNECASVGGVSAACVCVTCCIHTCCC